VEKPGLSTYLVLAGNYSPVIFVVHTR